MKPFSFLLTCLAGEGSTLVEADWHQVLDLSERHRVSALLFRRVREAGFSLPTSVREELARRDRRDRLLALRQAAELVRFSRLAACNGIEFIPLKGVMLSLRLYGDPCLRQSKDIDLMVRPEHLAPMDQILSAEGYRRTSPPCDLSSKEERIVRRVSHHYSYVHPDRGIEVELHWGASFWTDAQRDCFWEECGEIAWGGQTFRFPSDEALLAYLIDHGSIHEWMRIKWLLDVVRLLAVKETFDHDRLRTLLTLFDMERSAWQCGELMHRLLGVTPPTWMIPPESERPSMTPLVNRALSVIGWSDHEIATAGRRLNGVHRTIYLHRLRPRLPLHALLGRLLFTPADFGVVRIHPKLFFLYPLFRPLFWFWRNFVIHKSRWMRKASAGADSKPEGDDG